MDVDVIDSLPVRTKHYQLVNQRVNLEIDFNQRIKGTTYLTIFPESLDIKAVVLNARQCRIEKITINGLKPASIAYADPCDTLALHIDASVHQHSILQEKLANSLNSPPEPELVILLPRNLKITENPEFVVQTADGIKATKLGSVTGNDAEAAEALADTQVSRYTRLEVVIDFSSIHTRDALHFATGTPGSGRWPHVYTRGGFLPGRASCLFPCMDSPYYRCTWEISITGPRTVGDALRQMEAGSNQSDRTTEEAQAYEAREMVFVCPGEITDDVLVKNDSSRRTVSYAITSNVAAQHIGFAIGPFDTVDLSTFRDADKLELLQENAAPVMAFCLPGRKLETENTCLPTTDALDHFVISYAPYPFNSFSYCFVDDHPDHPASFAGITVCSSRLLYPENVFDPAQEVTRTLIQAMTTQWLGIQIIPRQAEDTWVVVGSAHFITELFMKDLCGNNEYRFRMKRMADKICKLDHQRPSLWDMGALLHIDPAEYEFLALKSPIVLYILDRRIAKTIGSAKVGVNIGKFMSKARNEDLKDNLLSTQEFCRMMEKALHSPIDDFINQWVKGAGCPQFSASQKFNKKKLVIEMTIRQIQANTVDEHDLDPDTFMRDVREEFHSIYAATPQNVFTGPMTIRIHEADGTPYEHIIHIKEAITKVEVPYNTKYKRLKRSKKQRARNAAARGENEDDSEALVYCLGDVLQDDEEIEAWNIIEWSQEDENRMNSESYEWIRLDADFEWISSTRLVMAGHMFVSQLQQDRDVAAQLVSIQHISEYSASGLISSILLRTMMDSRYFHGIRTAAATALVKHASNDNNSNMIGLFHLRKAFEDLYCVSEAGSIITRPNDFSDQLAYLLQCAIIEAISRVRDDKGYTPQEVKEFLLDKLKFNDNSQNEYSDAHYLSTLIRALSSALIDRPAMPPEDDLRLDRDLELYWANVQDFERSCLDEIDRYRRMDEWTSSYQNLYSRTAVQCQAKLARAGIGRTSSLHFLQYTRPGNFDVLRCTAFDIIAANGLFTNANILRYFIHCMVADTSPWIRHRLQQAFGKALARRAIGLERPSHKSAAQVVEMDISLDAAQTEADVEKDDTARRTSVEAALIALKREVGSDVLLQQCIWQALNYPESGFEDVRTMLDFCQMLFPDRVEARVVVKLPRYWKMEIVGKGKLKFSRSNKIRTKRMEKWKPRVPLKLNTLPPMPPVRQNTNKIKLTFGRKDSIVAPPSRQNSTNMQSPVSMRPTPTPTPPPRGSTPQNSQQARPKLTLKLKGPGSG